MGSQLGQRGVHAGSLEHRTPEVNQSYEAWLQEAGPHLGPIFKSIKSHEQTQQRPFQDAELLLRPYFWLCAWIEKWQGTLLPLPVEAHPALQDLQARAQAQSSALPRITAGQLFQALQKTGNKAGGPDEWSYKSARAVTEEECVSIAKAYGVMEEELQVPHSLRVTQVALLPKSDERERPISLTSIWWRVYTKLRRSLLEV